MSAVEQHGVFNSESIQTQLLDHSEDGIFSVDTNLRIQFWNTAMETVSGLHRADIYGQYLFDLLPFLIDNGDAYHMQQAMSGTATSVVGKPFRIIATHRHGYYNARYAPLYGSADRIQGVMVSVRNVTEQHNTLQAIHETELRFKTMADVAPVLLWMSRTDGMCTFFNQTWLNFTGRTLEQEWGVGWAEGIYFEDFQRSMDTYADAFSKRQTFSMEYRLRRADGEYRWILDQGTPRYTPDHTFAGYIGSCTDITELKQLEQQLRSSVRWRDEFLTIASHELRTPIAAMRLQLDSLARSVSKRPEEALKSGRIAQNVEMAQKQSARLIDLIANLLDISHLSEGHLVLNCEQVDLVSTINNVIQRLEGVATQSGCKLVAPSDCTISGYWDRQRLEQVITNLIENGIKYGAGKPVEVHVTQDNQDAVIMVSDHGLGIDKAAQRRIFERFERNVSAKQFGGFGLGLWISKQIVIALGGNICVDSAIGQGATFTVRLPRQKLASSAAVYPVQQEGIHAN